MTRMNNRLNRASQAGLLALMAFGIVAAFAADVRRIGSSATAGRVLTLAELDTAFGDACTNPCVKEWPCTTHFIYNSSNPICGYCAVTNKFKKCCPLGKDGQACTVETMSGTDQQCGVGEDFRWSSEYDDENFSCNGCNMEGEVTSDPNLCPIDEIPTEQSDDCACDS